MSNIHRAYHAIQRLSTSAGKPTNAVYGFVTMLRKLLREHTPDLVAAAWDGPQRTQRHEAYAEYKANRKPMADDLASQIPEIREVLDAYRIPILELPGFEADDVIGTLAAKAAAAGLRRRHRDGRQGHAPARRAARARVPHRQGDLLRRVRRRGVLRRAARPGGRRPGPHGRQRGQRPRRSGRGAGDREEVDLGVRKPDRAAGARGRHQGKGRREPAPEHRGRASLTPPGRDSDGPSDPLRRQRAAALRAGLRPPQGDLRAARVPFPRRGDPG